MKHLSFSSLAVVLFSCLLNPGLSIGKTEKKESQESEHKHTETEKEGHGDSHDEAEEHGHDESKEKHDHEDAHGEDAHEEEARPSVGEGKAVVRADKRQGIQLSEESEKFLEIQYESLQTRSSGLEVPSAALLYTMNEVGVYRRRDKWLKLVDVKVISSANGKSIVTSPDLRDQDQVVTTGSAIVRLADLEAFGASGDGHGH
ncbi:MAG: hypothetical protein K2X47_08015 [Bdellovibrionales bacterium]|nr:hypothetical protein [Bdellovibrionales bacterium]